MELWTFEFFTMNRYIIGQNIMNFGQNSLYE